MASGFTYNNPVSPYNIGGTNIPETSRDEYVSGYSYYGGTASPRTSMILGVLKHPMANTAVAVQRYSNRRPATFIPPAPPAPAPSPTP